MLKKYYPKHKDKYRAKRRTFGGVLYQRWRGIIQRERGDVEHYTTSIGRGRLTKAEFYAWAKDNPIFLKLYNHWVESGFDRSLSPSIDRKDVSKGYFLDNMQWITMKQNNCKKQQDHINAFGKMFNTGNKKVRLWKNTGEEMFFDSGKEASKYFGKNRLAVTNNIIMGHKLQGWNCEWQ